MAGIGFELRKILKKDTLMRNLGAFSIASIISSGPWVISILSILILGILVISTPANNKIVVQFQISVTYLIAFSLILSGFAQHGFTRYVADQLFLNKAFKIIPNLNGMMSIVTLISGILSFLFVFFFFQQESTAYRFLFMSNFVVLCNIWVLSNLLSGLKNYTRILLAFFFGYGLIISLGYLLREYGIEGFMFCFLVGNLVLFFILNIAIYKEFSFSSFIDFDFIKGKKIHSALIFSSFFYNSGIWIDKFIFWYNPMTSQEIIGPLRGSIIYDIPIFLAYLALIPGMAIFLLRVETDFVDYYKRFYDAIRNGQTLHRIQVMHDQMTAYAHNAILEILKIQSFTIVFVFLFGEKILKLLHISPFYKNLLFIDVIGTSLQVVFLAILNILYYLDKRRQTLWLCAYFLILNFIFTLISIHLGPFFYGYGFTLALTVVCVLGMYQLSYEFDNLEYTAIMLQ